MNYPDSGELFKASIKKSEHLVFFAHFFRGHKKALKKHVDLVNELGFDAYVFNLKDDLKDHQFLPYSQVSKKFGMKHALADQIEEHLNLHANYKTKIMFAFSNVSGCAVEALARRQTNDVVAMICDSGPGSHFIYSSYKLLQEQMQVHFLPLRLLCTPLVMYAWSPSLHKDVPEDFNKLPENFPVLSIRGWQDKMISPSHIDEIFEAATQLRWQKLTLPEAGHLNGLKNHPNEYRLGLTDFLKNI